MSHVANNLGRRAVFMLIFVTSALLSACSSPTYHYHYVSKHIKQQPQHQKKAVNHKHYNNRSSISKNYHANQAIPISKEQKEQPAWLYQTISVRTEKIPLNVLLDQLLRYSSVSINFGDATQPQQVVSLHYHGTLKGALDALAATTNNRYQVQPQQISWQAFETKTFDVSFMPNGNASHDERINSQQQQINMQSPAWHDLGKAIEQLTSEQGKMLVSEATTTVTVRDRPNNIRAIEQYIQQLSQHLSQQVAIKVRVLAVTLNKDFNYGIDWNLLSHALGTSNADDLRINSKNSNVLIRALNQQGSVRVLTEPEVITLNNQIAAIRITQRIGYVQGVSQTNTRYTNTHTINLGDVTDGFTLYVLPNIQQHAVFMQISSTIAKLEQLRKVSTNADNDLRYSPYRVIEVPTLSQQSFNQRSLVKSGNTLIITGYKKLENSTDNTHFGVQAPVKRNASTSNVETLVLITPTIIHNSSPNVSTYSK